MNDDDITQRVRLADVLEPAPPRRSYWREFWSEIRFGLGVCASTFAAVIVIAIGLLIAGVLGFFGSGLDRRPGDGIQRERPWWYSLALRVVPKRCREIPEADNPTWCEHRDPFMTTDIGKPLPAALGVFDGEPTAITAGCVGLCRQCGAPPRILLRQVSIWKRHWYVQQFACSEDPRFMHSHPARWMLVIGLWGGYLERRIAGAPIERRAPYVYTMDRGHVHHVQRPGAGHTSLFLMFGVQHDAAIGDKQYFGTPGVLDDFQEDLGVGPTTLVRPWGKHIRRMVARI